MSNILIFLDMPVKHVHLYPYRWFHIKYRSMKKLKTDINWKTYDIDNQSYKLTRSFSLRPQINKDHCK